MRKQASVSFCHEQRCRACTQAGYPDCLGADIIEDTAGGKNNRSVVLVEKTRGIIHVSETSRLPVTPPWETDSWESVIIDDTIFDYTILHMLADVYVVGPYLSIFCKGGPNDETNHFSFPLLRSRLESDMLRKLVEHPSGDSQEAFPSRTNLNSRIDFMKTVVSRQITDLVPEVSIKTRERISEIVAHKRTVLGQFFPLLLDDEIEEIYVDRPCSLVYFDHSRLGRCLSQFVVADDEVERIVTVIRSESNLHADRMNPSLKTDFAISDVPLRFSMTLPPLSPDGFSLEIRKPRKRPYDILELVSNGTLTPVAAAVLVLATCSRFNITITGTPGCGKTTLLNALDMTTPSDWRKVYIEDAAESRVISGHHQVKLQVDPIDETRNRLNKSDEIIKTLHRSPDYLVLGEIQSAEHSRALFQAVSAGLSSIQTCHSQSGAGLVSRWSNDHGIEKSSIALMDLIVTMDRPEPGKSERHVTEIAEIRRGLENGLMVLRGLNVVYRSGQRTIDDDAWAEDGAFRLKAQQHGLPEHADAYLFLAEVMENAIENPGSLDPHSLGNLVLRREHGVCSGKMTYSLREKGS